MRVLRRIAEKRMVDRVRNVEIRVRVRVRVRVRAPFWCPIVPGRHSSSHIFTGTTPVPICAWALFR